MPSLETRWPELVETFQPVSLNLNEKLVAPERLEAIRKREPSLKILSYTVNRLSRAQALFSWGVDAIFTDTAPMMLQSLPFQAF